MTQEEFIQKTMIALMGNPKVTNSENFDSDSHHTALHQAAVGLSCIKDDFGSDDMFFDDLNTPSSENYPDAVSQLECLAVIGEALQAIANNKTIKEQQEASDGNFERHTYPIGARR